MARRSLLLSSSLWALLSLSTSASAQSFSAYSDFQAMSVRDLDSLQVKFTNVGPRKRAIPTLAFTTPARALDVLQFAPFERPGFPYDDEDTEALFTASPREMKALIDSVGTLPNVVSSRVDSAGYVSFGMVNTIDGQSKGFEAIVNSASGRLLFAKILEAMAGNPPALKEIRLCACANWMMPSRPPADVSGQVTVELRSIRFDREQGTSTAILRVRNHGATALPAPIAVALVLSGNPRILDPDDYTCLVEPNSAPLIRVLATRAFRPGQAVEREISIENYEDRPIVIKRSSVLAGPGWP